MTMRSGRFFKRDMCFHAVRGELTRRSVERMTGRTLDIPTGDGGILASELLDTPPEKRYDVGIVPHVCDLSDPAVTELLGRYENAKFINVKDDPIAVLTEIAQCRCILSSSLHGLIAADSFHIPNLHIVFPTARSATGISSMITIPPMACSIRRATCA